MEKIPEKIMVITVTDSRNHPNYFWMSPLKMNFKKLLWFDLGKAYFNNGKVKTQKILLNLFEKEKPNYLLMFDSLYHDLDIISLIKKLRVLSPETKTIFFSGDDDLRFDSVRYLALFFDYVLCAQNDFVSFYEKDGLNNVSFILAIDNKKIKLNEKEIYDVSFVGTPKADRREILEYLHEKGVKLSVFGYNWWKYSKLKKIYGGVITQKEHLKIIAQTKINVCFSKNMFGLPHLKGRFIEVSNLGSFSLVEYSPQLAELFKEEKEIIFFRTKEELLKKINYYLKHEKEREKIIKAAQKKISPKFNFEKNLQKFIKRTVNLPVKKVESIPKLSYSIKNLNEDFMNLPKGEIINKIKDFDYISFSKGKVIRSPFKEYLQIYSIIKNKKNISCCDYLIYSRYLGDYAQFRYCPYGHEPNRDYRNLLNINQIVMTKDFFISNFESVKRAYKTGFVYFVNNSNTAFVSIPLVKISKFRKGFFKDPEFSNELGLFLFSAHRELYSRKNKPLKFLLYSLYLFLEILAGKKFIFNQLKRKFSEMKKI